MPLYLSREGYNDMPPGFLRSLAGIVLSVLLASAAAAATLTPSGVVLVNRGNGFARVSGPTEVVSGDMIMVNEGTAQLSYADGSGMDLQPGQVYTVGNIGAAPPPTQGVLPDTALVIGGVLIVGGAVAVIAGTNKKSSSP